MSDWQLFYNEFKYVEHAPYSDPLPDIKEIWIKGTFIYAEQVAGNDNPFINISAGKWGYAGYRMQLREISNPIYLYNNTSYNDYILSSHYLTLNTDLSFIVHLFSDANNGIFEVFWSDGSKDTIVGGNGNVNDGDYFDKLDLSNSSNKVFVSNVIVSNQQLTFDSQPEQPEISPVVWLKFDDSPIDDAMGNSWEMYHDEVYSPALGQWTTPDPTISPDYAIRGNAFQGDGKSYIALYDFMLCGQSFCITGFAYIVSGNVFCIDSANTYADVLMELAVRNSHITLSFNRGYSDYNSQYYPIYLESSVTAGNFVNFKVCYDCEHNSVYFYLNNNLEGSCSFSRPYPRQPFRIRVGYGNFFFQKLVGAVDEFRIFDGANDINDGLSKIIPAFFKCDTLRNVKKNITSYHDTQRRVTYNGVWRYENYGTANLLSIAGTTVTDLTKSQAIYKSAFYQPTQAKCFDIPATKEIWIKCHINVVVNVTSSRIRIYNQDSNGNVCGWSTNSNSITNNYDYWINGTNHDGGYRISRNDEGEGKQPFLLHMKSGVTDGFLEFYFHSKSNNTYRSFTGNVNNGNDFDNVYIQMNGSNIYVSDLIISNAQIDINEHTTFNAAFNADLLLAIIDVNQELFFHSLRNVVSSQQIQFPLCRHLISANDIVFDTFRNVLRTVDLDCDTVRTMPHKIFLSVIADTPNNLLANSADIIDVPEDNEDLQSFEISINEQQLTDVVTFSSVNHFNLLEQVKGQYLDYKFNLRIELMQERGILSYCQCCSDNDELLYRQTAYYIDADFVEYEIDRVKKQIRPLKPNETLDIDSDSKIEGAYLSSHLIKIAAAIGKHFDTNSPFQFNNFVSSMSIKQDHVTYQDLLRNLVGWTSRVPHMQINIFIRDDYLHCIQRGYEKNTIYLDDVKHTVPTFNRKLVRTMWSGGSPDEEFTITRHIPDFYIFEYPPEYSDDGKTFFTYRQIRSSYKEALFLLTGSTTRNDDGSYSTVDYHYTSSPPYELTSERRISYDANGNVVDDSTTYHKTLTPSQRHSKKVSDGNEESSVVGSHVAGLYNAMKLIQGAYDETDTAVIQGSSLIDTSFPVLDKSKLIELTRAIKWLNRKIEETVSLDIYDYPHIFDFNDKFIFNGNTFYFKGNIANKTSRITNKQSLQIVRWY